MRNRVVKGSIVFLCIFLLGFMVSGCSSSGNTTATQANIEGCSEEAQKIIDSLDPDDRIDAVYEAQRIIANLNWKNEKKFLEGIEDLNQIAVEYDKQYALKRLNWLLSELKEPEKHGGIDFDNKEQVDNVKKQLEFVFNDIFYLVVDVYKDQNSYDYPMDVDIEKFVDAISVMGYSHKIENGNSEIYYFPENISIEDGSERGKGSNVSIDYDNHGNVVNIHTLPPLLNYGASEQDIESFLSAHINTQREIVVERGLENIQLLKNIGLSEDQILGVLFTQDEIAQFESFIGNFSAKDVEMAKQHYLTDQDFALRYNLIFSNKEILLTMSPNQLQIMSVRATNSELSQYDDDVYCLQLAFSNEDSTENNIEGTKNLYYNVEMSDFPISQHMSKETLNSSVESNIQVENEKWYEKYNSFVREDGKYICTVWFQDDGTLGFEMDGLTIAVISNREDDFAPNSYLYESIQDGGTYDFLYNYADKVLSVADSVTDDDNDYAGTYILKP